MNRQHLEDRLDDYLDGALAPEVATAAESHLAACPDCARELARARRTRSLLAAAAAPPLARSLYPAVADRIHAGASTWLRLGFAGAAAAALAAGLLLGNTLGRPDGTAPSTLTMLAAQGSTLLADGGEPTLDDLFLDLGGLGTSETEEAP